MAKPYGNEAEDKFYHWKGAKPPERNPHMTRDELYQVLQEQIANHTCKFYQRGNLIVCEEGDGFAHGKRLKTTQRLLSPDGKLGTLEPVYRK